LVTLGSINVNNGLFEMWREMGRKRIGAGIKGRRAEGQGWGVGRGLGGGGKSRRG
jgi:hypothetical protein